MEGVTGVIRTADSVVNVHSGNQLRISIDVGEQLAPGARAHADVEWKVSRELNVEAVDPFLASKAGMQAPWASAAGSSMGPMTSQQSVPEPSTMDINRGAGSKGGAGADG